MMVEDFKLKKKVTLGLILIFLGILLLLNNSILERREEVFSEMNLELTELLAKDEEKSIEEKNTEEGISENEEDEEIVSQETDYESYLGVLDIPKIGFNKGFYSKESSLNNVKFNLKILPDSSYPNEDKGNVIIIGHSGNYNNSYFANLYQLNVGDTANITYMGNKYNYKIVDIYTDTKDGTVTIYRDENKSCLTLITCTKDDDTKQTIYILELINVE